MLYNVSKYFVSIHLGTYYLFLLFYLAKYELFYGV